MESHIYSHTEAQEILNAFPSHALNELLELAQRAKYDPQVYDSNERITLPNGWAYQLYGNCIIVRYQDGEQERKAFFVPQIWIEFRNTETIKAEQSVLERFALGYCSCGKPMPFIQAMLWASDRVASKGFWHFPSRMLGYVAVPVLLLWIWLRPVHHYSVEFNRHPECL